MGYEMSEQNVRALQISTAVIEIRAGFALLIFPSVTAELLLGQKLESLVDLSMARFSGAGFIDAWDRLLDGARPAA